MLRRQTQAPRDRLANGAKLYAEFCAAVPWVARVEGAPVSSLPRLNRGEPTLADVIDRAVPLGAPERCKGDCAKDVAAYVMGFHGAVPCAPPIGDRGLRLLTRRDTSPPWSISSARRCSAVSRRRRRATRRPSPQSEGQDVRQGARGGQLQRLARDDRRGRLGDAARRRALWSRSARSPTARTQYKFVLDGAVDQPIRRTRSDGPGRLRRPELRAHGELQHRRTRCSTRPGGRLPAETRPGFPFDNHGPGRVVTTVHVEQYLRAAASRSRSASTCRALAPCDRQRRRDACAGRVRASSASARSAGR